MSDPLAARGATPRPTPAALDLTTAGDPPPAAAPHAPPPTDRYRLGDELARGGMGVVYAATDAVLGREVAVKVLQDKFAGTTTARRFADEARIAAQLQHPSVPPVYDLGVLPDGRPFLAMKLIKGETLAQLLAGPADRGRFVAAFEAVCQAVAYAHSHGVIHRDLKPANVMVGAFGEVQVMDWGLAKVLATGGRQPPESEDPDATAGGTVIRPGSGSHADPTQAGSVVGTPAFMPPEQAVGAVGQVDRRSDVFGLGAVLAVVLTGKPPYAGATGEETRVLAARGKLDDCFARLDASGADPELVALAKRCLAPDQDRRPADAGEVAAAVAALRAAADDRARRAEVERERAEVRTAEGRKRRRVLTAAGALLVAILGAGVVGTSVGMVRAEDARQDEAKQRGQAEKNEKAAKAARDELAAALAAEAKARREAEESYQLAREAVVGVAWEIPGILRQAVFAREAEKKVSLVLAETMQKQLALAATRHLPDRAAHAIQVRLGDLRVNQAKYDEAEGHYAAALKVSERVLAAEAREKDRAKADHATSHLKLGALGLGRPAPNDAAAAFDHLRRAVALFREVADAPTTGEVPPAEAKFLLADALHELAAARARRQEYDPAAAAAAEAVRLRAAVLGLPPTRATAGVAARLGDSRVLLGEIEFKRGNNAAAVDAVEAGVELYEQEVAKEPYDIDLRRKAAAAHRAAGDLFVFLGRPDLARRHHARDLSYSRSVVSTAEIVAAQLDLSYALYRSGVLAGKRADPDAARAYFRQCVRVREEASAAQPKNEVTRVALARALARAGDHLGAVAAFEPVERRYARSLNVQSQAAVVYGLCADALRAGRPLADLPPADRGPYDAYLTTAFAALDRAVTDWDWLDIVGLRTDPDFDPLRGDPRFAAAVAKVEARLAGKKP
jgi:tetratricopeptide (TPR) repeat protein